MVECKKCGKCCISYPCALHPDDLPKIAWYLNLTIEETNKKYLIWDYWIGDNGNEYYLCPKRKGDNGITIASWSWAFSSEPCIFLDNNNLCEIHEVKPLNGKLEFCEIDNCSYTKEHARIAWKEHPFNPNYK